ncbi:MAG: serine/threonine-protein phosphatase [Firmicutes bacterium]|nr:serine/threonine-protein phosphatase [Bacillota bacterium]
MGIFSNLFKANNKNNVPAVMDDNMSTAADTSENMSFDVSNVQGIGDREQQEDSFAVLNVGDVKLRKTQGLFAVVADGMGGMENGKFASEMVIDYVCELFRLSENIAYASALVDELPAVNNEIFNYFNGRSGSTLVAVRIFEGKLQWVSVGDSAIFIMRNGGVFQLNKEHAFINDLYEKELKETVICRERAENHEDAPRLTSFVGMDNLKEIDYNKRLLKLQKGDTLLLCSDGISGVLTPAEILEALSLEATESCRMLETFVLEKCVPEQDNYTGIVIRCR